MVGLVWCKVVECGVALCAWCNVVCMVGSGMAKCSFVRCGVLRYVVVWSDVVC